MTKISRVALLFIALFTCMDYTNAQEVIDVRLMKNDPVRAKQNYRYNTNSYNYMLFELDESWKIVAKESLSKEEQTFIQQASVFKTAEGTALTKDMIVPGTFNFYDFGVRLIKDQRIYIALDKETVLVFYSIREMSKLFTASPGNTK